MIKLLDVFRLSDGKYILACKNLPDKEYDGPIETNIGMFSKEQYSIGEFTSCFTDEMTYGILIDSDLDCTKITYITFPDLRLG